MYKDCGAGEVNEGRKKLDFVVTLDKLPFRRKNSNNRNLLFYISTKLPNLELAYQQQGKKDRLIDGSSLLAHRLP